MDHSTHETGTHQLIDLTKQTDAAFWCRVFDVTMEQLREAVHHAGHRVDEVSRYLRGDSAAS